MIETEVLIVGSGPAGASAAALLSSYSISNIVVTKYKWLADTPRAHITSQRTMEIFDELGIMENIMTHAVPNRYIGNSVICQTLAGKEIGRIKSWGAAPSRVSEYRLNSPDANEIDRLYELHPDIEIIVNNIGIYGAVDFDESTDKDWFDIFDINVMSGVRLSRKYAPIFRKNNWGRVVFISSESAINIPKEMIHYGFSKTAQLAISRGLAETFAGTGVTVNSVLPGPTFTDGVQDFVASIGGKDFDKFTEEYFRSVRPTSITKRFSSPEEIGNTVAFVCSELASSITGAAIRVDGGAVKACF